MMRTGAVSAVILLAAARAAAQAPARLDVTVRPETVTVGQPFQLSVRVRVPSNYTVVFPGGPDSTGWVQALDPRTLTSARASDSVDRTATYRLAAWNVGAHDLNMPEVMVRAGGQVQHLSLGGLTVFVKSVLPADSSRRVPKPARDLILGRPFPWWILAVLAVIAVVAWITRRRRRNVLAVRRPTVSPFERAEREFTRVAALGLVEAGERGRYVALVVEVLRDYLFGRFPLASLSLTTDELLREIADAPSVPHERLARLLVDADLVKFARRGLTTDRALELGREARGVVTHEHVASTPAPGVEAA
jgi:hypothetical protein